MKNKLKRRIPKYIILTLSLIIVSASYIAYAYNNDKSKASKKVERVDEKAEIIENKEPVVMKPSTIKYNERQALLFDLTYEDTKTNTVISPLAFEMQLALGADENTIDEIGVYTGKSIEEIKENYNKTLIKELPTIIIDGDIGNSDEADTSDSSESKISIDKNIIRTSDIRNVISENMELAENIDGDDINKVINQIIIGEESRKLTSVYELDNSKISFNSKSKDVFHRFGDKNSNVTMLNSVENIYLENKFATGFMKPLSGNNEIMFVGILPNKKGAFDLLELDIDSLISSQTYEKVKVGMPEIQLNKSYDLTENMLMLGIKGWIENPINIVHKIRLDITGENTILMQTNKLPDSTDKNYVGNPDEKMVYLNRPFGFLLYDTVTCEYILMGKITNPRVNTNEIGE